MGKDSKISWTNHTFNPWWACSKVSAECANCYAETLAKRFGFAWGATADPRFFDAHHWNEPLRWNREAEKTGVRARVFCGSMCDVFEDREAFKPHRDRLWELIFKTPMLDWLLLTKRPENFARMHAPIADNVWKGTTAGTEATLKERLPHLMATHGVKFLSMEPLLEAVNLRGYLLEPQRIADCQCGHGHGFTRCPNTGGIANRCHHVGCSCTGFRRVHGVGVDLVIVGGESGPSARPCNVEHVRAIVRQCKDASVPVFVKQLGAVPVIREVDRSLTGPEVLRADRAICAEWPEGTHFGNPTGIHELNGRVVRLRDRAGADPAEWPGDLRVRQMPEVRR